MRKFSLIFAVGAMSLALSGATRLQAKTSSTTASPVKSESSNVMLPHGVAKGEISSVDLNGHVFTLKESQRNLSLSFDDKTHITQSGQVVQPSAITTGEKAKVKFVEHDGKSWATNVELHAVHHAKMHSPKATRNSGKS